MRSFIIKYLFVLFILCFATWSISARFDHPRTGIDDSYIFFVYAENFARGHGFVYNIGGERVEGFSSLLWTLICTVVLSFSSQPEMTLILVNMLILALGVTAAISFIQSSFPSPKDSRQTGVFWSLVFLVLLFISPTYLAWNTIALMENAAWSTLLLLATVFVIRENISPKSINSVFIPLAVLLLLTRPESYLWIAAFVMILFVRRTLAGGKKQAVKELLPLMTAILVAVLSLTVFRLLYFGYPLPNTYYAKVSPFLSYNFLEGIKYFAEYFVSNPIVSNSILAAALAGVHTILVRVDGKFPEDGRLFLPVLAGTGLAVPVITGGDHFSSFRFYQAIYPILLLCLLYFVRVILPQYVQFQLNPNALRRSQLIFASSLVLLFLSGVVLYQGRDWSSSKEISAMSDEFDIAEDGRDTGQFARELFTHVNELPTVGIIRAGGLKYTYSGEVIDLMGLNNLLMAHNGGSRQGEKNHAAFEKSTFYHLRPDILNPEIASNKNWQYSAEELSESWDNLVPLKGLYDDPEFLELYVYASVNRKEMPTGKALVGWFEKDFLRGLEATGYFVIERYVYTTK